MPTLLSIICLFVLGFCLMFVEIVIIPGFGFTGILAIISLLSACYIAFSNLSPILGVLITFVSLIMVFGLFKILPKTSFWQKTRLSLTQNKEMGYQVAAPELLELKGKTGIALTILRPSGTVLIDSKHYDVITDNDFIEKDSNIKVKDVQGNKIIVTKTS